MERAGDLTTAGVPIRCAEYRTTRVPACRKQTCVSRDVHVTS